MSEAWDCMPAYQKLTDSILDDIMKSNDAKLQPSKDLLSRIHNRDLYKCVYESLPRKVFISICYYKIDGTILPTMLILLLRRSTLYFLFVRYHDLVIRDLDLAYRYLELIIHYYEYYRALYYNAVLPVICGVWHFTHMWNAIA